MLKKKGPISFQYFNPKHIKYYKYESQIENKIKDDIIEMSKEIERNYENFLIYNVKYNKILDEYDKSYQYMVMNDDVKNNLKKGKITFKNIVEEHTQLLIDKISQDISFILSFSIKNKNNIKKLIDKDILSIFNFK